MSEAGCDVNRCLFFWGQEALSFKAGASVSVGDFSVFLVLAPIARDSVLWTLQA